MSQRLVGGVSKVRWSTTASRRRPTYPDFVIDQSVLCILVKLFLRVDIDPIGSQLLSNLQAQAKIRGGLGPSISDGTSREEVRLRASCRRRAESTPGGQNSGNFPFKPSQVGSPSSHQSSHHPDLQPATTSHHNRKSRLPL